MRRRYRKELEAKKDLLRSLKADARKGTITFLFAAKDTVHVNAQVLEEMIETEPGRVGKKGGDSTAAAKGDLRCVKNSVTTA